MGLMRIALALAVIGSHLAPRRIMPGSSAVELFFVISGFLISYVLVEVNAYPRARTFWRSRYLRLWPIYIVVVAATVAASLVIYGASGHNRFIETIMAAPPGARVFLVFTNLTILLQDWTLFMGVHAGQLVFTPDFRDSEVLMPFGLAIPPGWSLGVELTFYALAPFIIRRKPWIVGLLLASLALRVVLVQAGIGTSDPWSYRFFPTELTFFLFGVLAHQVLKPLWARVSADRMRVIAPVVTGLALVSVFAWHLLPGSNLVKIWPYAIGLAAVLPVLFAFQQTRRWDRVVGEVSYPLYVVHWLVIVCVTALASHWGLHIPLALLVAIVVVLSAIGAVGLYLGIGKPVDRWRHRLTRRDVTASASS